MIIYLIANTNTNKVYVGQTVRTLEVRWQGHLARARQPRTAESANTHLYNSMRKHGIENFTIEVIDRAHCQEELDFMERYYIQKYNSVEEGYNTLTGGEYQPMDNPEVREKHLKRVQSEEFRNKVSKSMKEYKKKNGVSEETRRKLSGRNKEAYRRGRPYNYFTKEDIEKATLAKQKSVVVLYKGTEYKFSSIKQSCVWVNENVFDNKFGIRSIQGMATRSRKRGCAINEVTWIYQ